MDRLANHIAYPNDLPHTCNASFSTFLDKANTIRPNNVNKRRLNDLKSVSCNNENKDPNVMSCDNANIIHSNVNEEALVKEDLRSNFFSDDKAKQQQNEHNTIVLGRSHDELGGKRAEIQPATKIKL